ncbi:hypothetical protein SO802_031870 [Lithocarpus litseifolius]|uniref:Uncharacterized protein n=1 Tax=Lithocarpus litseifolius TaxID=425828 RepID=A0AAW2BLQ0_9ROSI
MNSSPSNAPKNPYSAEPLEGDHPDIPLKDSDSTTPEKVTEPKASVYGEWMVVTWRKKPNGNASRLAMGDLAKGENNPSWEINNRRDPKGPDGDYRMVQCRRDGGIEEYLPFNRGNSSGTSDFTKKSSFGEAYRNGSHGDSVQGEAPVVLGPIYSTHSGYMQESRSDWSAETCSESIPRDHSREERSETCMDFEGDRGGAIPDLF